MALLVVVVAIAVLTALAAQLAYSARVRLQLAGDARDDLRAMWLAKSGVATSRLVLAFQQQIDATTGNTAVSGGGGVAGALSLKIRIWSLVPISSGLVNGLFGGGPAPDAPARPANERREGPAVSRFGDFDGAFEASIADEGAKVNAQLDAGQASGLQRSGVLALFQLMCDARWDPLFDREDANGQRTTRQELIQNLRDWVDDKSVTTSLAATFPGAPCDAIVAERSFEDGFGDENFLYDRGPSEERYRTKNARFDSLDELYLVQGYTDAVGAAFGDQLTVYLPVESRRTIDPRNPAALRELANMVANPPGQAILLDPEFPVRLQKAIMEQTLGGLLGMDSAAFAATLQALGVLVSTDVTTAGSPRNPIGDRSYVYRIRSTGAAGQVSRTLDVVVTYDPNKNRGDATAGNAQDGTSAGRVLRWREE